MKKVLEAKNKEYCITIPMELVLYVKAENEEQARDKYAHMSDDEIKNECVVNDLPYAEDVIVEECLDYD